MATSLKFNCDAFHRIDWQIKCKHYISSNDFSIYTFEGNTNCKFLSFNNECTCREYKKELLEEILKEN
jgi:hypothetical protein